jgi:hypothetical protein
MLEAESQKYRLMLPALQASNSELTKTVARLREREMERMQVAIEAEKSANQLRSAFLLHFPLILHLFILQTEFMK